MANARPEAQRGIDQLLARLEKLHSAPTVALKVMQLTRDPEFETRDVVECLEHDPALAASILRLVNSSYYGLAHEVAAIQQAVTYLGPRSLRLAVLSFGLVKTLVKGAPAELYKTYWKRSLTMATAARAIAQKVNDRDASPDTAFAAGLLADLGMLVLVQLETQRYLPMAMEPDHVGKLVALERDAFGFDHTAVGTRLLTRWQLPGELIAAVDHHHACSAAAPLLSLLVFTANLLAEVLWTPKSPHMQPLQTVLKQQLDCDVDDLITLALECKEALNENAEILQVQLDGEIDVESLQQQARWQFDAAALGTAADLDSLEAFTFHPLGGTPVDPREIPGI